MPPEYEERIRTNKFAELLQKKGYDVKVVSSSVLHNSDVDLMENSKAKIMEAKYDNINYVHVKTSKYKGNGIDRVLNHILFGLRLILNRKKISNKPDIIICDTYVPFAVLTYFLARLTKSKFVLEVRDLWPESIVVYGSIQKNSLIAKILYYCEKWTYNKADSIIFTMEGATDYLSAKKLLAESGGSIDLSKVHHINNGVDLENFELNKTNFTLSDGDLENEGIFKVIYTGSIRTVNKIDMLVEVAKKIQNKKVKILIWGAGDKVEEISKMIADNNLTNIELKGKVEKRYVPYILSKANLNIIIGENIELFNYGTSFNKLFEYLASGKPILQTFKPKYSIIDKNGAGIELEESNVQNIIDAIEYFAELPKSEYEKICENSKNAAKLYDFKNLTAKLVDVINNL